jgi:hypothetical protein
MKCACGSTSCAADVGFDSASGLLLADLNAPNTMRVAGVYLSVETATILARQLKTFLLEQADKPAERTPVELPDGAHLP